MSVLVFHILTARPNPCNFSHSLPIPTTWSSGRLHMTMLCFVVMMVCYRGVNWVWNTSTLSIPYICEASTDSTFIRTREWKQVGLSRATLNSQVGVFRFDLTGLLSKSIQRIHNWVCYYFVYFLKFEKTKFPLCANLESNFLIILTPLSHTSTGNNTRRPTWKWNSTW